MRRSVVVAIAVVLLAANTANAQTWRCTATEKWICQPGAGCQQNPVTVFNRFDAARRTYSRCDIRGCDTYGAQVSQSGAFLIIDVPGRGMVAKTSIDGSSFVEIATLMMTTLVSYGACRPE
jgi:hypothetical protein